MVHLEKFNKLNTMKKIIYGLSLVLATAFASCKGDAGLSPTELEAKVNSLAAAKIEAANAQATTDCEARMATEVKSISDSISKAK
jgi:hypothetical protein